MNSVDTRSQNNHYRSASFLQQESNPTSNRSGGRSNTTIKTGIRVTTAYKFDAAPKSVSEDTVEREHFAFTQRVLKKQPREVGNVMHRSGGKVTAQNVANIEKLMREKVLKMEMVRLTRIIRELKTKENENQMKREMRYILEDFVETLDFTPEDDDFDLRVLRFKGNGPQGLFDISLGQGEEHIDDETLQRASFIEEGILVKDLPLLRDKLSKINLITSKGTEAFGRIEYKRSKFRVYDVKKNLIYKIIKGDNIDLKTKTLIINDKKGKAVSTVLIVHKTPFEAKCEVKFPPDCDFNTRFLLLSVLFSIMDQLKPFQEKSKSVFDNALFGFFSCAPKT